jgi:hypothetical protein
MDMVDVLNVREYGSVMNPYGYVLYITIGTNIVADCQ